MEIGQKVKVCRLRDRVSQDIINRLGQTGMIRDYRVLDGKEIGVIVQFDDKFTTWFFEDELASV
ncbi:MAG: cytochrome b6f subunit PetP [Thainema sp.]